MPARPIARRLPPLPPAVPTAPALRVPPRTHTHVRDGMLSIGCGVAAFGLVPLAGMPVLSWPALLTGVGGGIATWVMGERQRRRQDLGDRLLEALAPLLGVRQLDRRIVRLARWTGGWPGLPRRITVQYAPGAPDADSAWMSEVLAVVSGRLLARFEVRKHVRLRCRLELKLAARDVSEAVGPSHAQVRAERAIRELIGPTASVGAVRLGEDGQLCSLEVSHEAGAKLAASGYRNRVERVISTMMPGRWRGVWDLERDTVRFEVRPSLPSCVWIPVPPPSGDDLLRDYRGVAIPTAIDEDGREVLWYPGRVPHVMLTGGTGTGKTSESHALIGQITSRGWPVWVCDAKRVEFLDFRGWPNVQVVAGSIPQQVAVIHRAWQVMEDRYRLIEEGLARVDDFEPLVVFLDEYAEMRSNLLEWYAQIKQKGDPTRPPTLAQVASLARKGRTARIHLVLSTQRPDAEFLGGEMRDNFGFRISMGRLSPQGAMMMWENPAAGVSLPRGRTGRAMATHDDGRIVEVQCYRFPAMDAEGEERELLEALRPEESRHPRLVIVPPDPDGENPPRFSDYAQAVWALAEERPDLDPLAVDVEGRLDGRARSSTLATLGLLGNYPVAPALGGGADPLSAAPGEEIGEDLELLLEAATLVVNLQLGSVSMVQRKLRIGFAKAVHLMDVLEQRGVIGTTDGDGAREVLVESAGLDDLLRDLSRPVAVRRPKLTAVGSSGDRAEWPSSEEYDDGGVGFDEFAGYAAPISCPPHSVMVGDLLEVDTGVWGVVDEPPEEDLADPGCVAISWRGDGDESGFVSVPEDEMVMVRRPEEDA